MSTAEILLAFSGIALQAISLAVMYFKKTYLVFTWFFAYLCTNCFYAVVLFALRDHPRLYSFLYWTGDAIVNLLIFLAIYEIFRSVFLHFYSLGWFRMVFPIASLLLISAGSLRSILRSGPEEGFLIAQIFSFEIATYILQVGIFFLFLLLVRFFRLPWKQYTFGIALGFGLSAAGSLVAFIVRSEFGTKFVPIFRFVVPLTYTIGVAIWLLTFLWPVPKAELDAPTPALTPKPWLPNLGSTLEQ